MKKWNKNYNSQQKNLKSERKRKRKLSKNQRKYKEYGNTYSLIFQKKANKLKNRIKQIKFKIL